MKYCNDCHTYAAAQSLFCPTCGSSYDLKLCPKLHSNPASATYCRTCGSSRLSHNHHMPSRFSFRPSVVILLTLILTILSAAVFFIFFLPVPPILKILTVIIIISVLLTLVPRPHQP